MDLICLPCVSSPGARAHWSPFAHSPCVTEWPARPVVKLYRLFAPRLYRARRYRAPASTTTKHKLNTLTTPNSNTTHIVPTTSVYVILLETST